MNRKKLLDKWRKGARKLKIAAESEYSDCEYCGRTHSKVLSELLYSCIEQLETMEMDLTQEEKNDREFIHDVVQKIRKSKK